MVIFVDGKLVFLGAVSNVEIAVVVVVFVGTLVLSELVVNQLIVDLVVILVRYLFVCLIDNAIFDWGLSFVCKDSEFLFELWGKWLCDWFIMIVFFVIYGDGMGITFVIVWVKSVLARLLVFGGVVFEQVEA